MAPRATRRALRTAPRATRGKPSVSYAEPSSDDSELDEVKSESDRDTQSSRRTRLSNRSRATTKRRRSSPDPSDSDDSQVSPRRPLKKRKSEQTTLPKPTKQENGAVYPPVSGAIPSWQTLPYHILVEIFRYASYPLYDVHTFQPLESSRKLCKLARLCRSFAEPAFTVLYASPPLVPMDKARKVVDILKADPLPMAFKYRQKVESLHIDVGQVAAYSMGAGLGHLDLHGLIRNLPRLEELELYHQYDMAPYRMLDSNIKWTYPESLFQALEYVDPEADTFRGDKKSPCRLRSWRWSSRLAGKRWPIESICEVHLSQAFVQLKKIAFVNYQIPRLKKDEEDPKHEKILAESLSVLKNLEHLIFESSTLLNSKLLPLLPTTLRNIQSTNCWEITANDFTEFILTHGSQVRCLTLNHNQALSLSFLPSLAAACPKLQVLRMNLTYYKVHTSYNDSDPDYTTLLSADEVPSWPSTLQTIDLIQLRKWETEAAEMFFQSLLDSAGDLPDLRRITIQAILDIPWRERASFRDKWIGSLNRVFKRVSPIPKPRLSLKPSKPAQTVAVEIESAPTAKKSLRFSIGSVSTPPPLLTRKSSRNKSIDSSVPVLPPSAPSSRSTNTRRRSTRSNRSLNYAESSPENSEDEAEAEAEANPTTTTTTTSRAQARSQRAAREVENLKSTAGIHGSFFSYSDGDEKDGNKDQDGSKDKAKRKGKEIIQGMCEIVDLRIDNLRPMETQVTEADFLDSEPGEEEDPDWDGDDEDGGEGYAW